jgi:hypothetical protein
MYLLLLVFGGLLGAAGVVLGLSGLSLRDGTFDAAILTPGIVAAAGGLLLIGLGAGLRTLQRIERTLASRPMPRAQPIAESAKTAEIVETPRQPVRIPFVPKVGDEAQAGPAALESLEAKSQATAVAGGKNLPPIGASPLAVPDATVETAASHSSKNGNGAAGIRPGLRMPSSFRRASANQSEPALDALWPKGPRPSRAVEASPAPIAPQGSNVTPIQSQQTADVVHAPATLSNPDGAISVLKSGVVNGMPYTLYSDGSIEAQLAEGTLRFGSISELRNHIEQSA